MAQNIARVHLDDSAGKSCLNLRNEPCRQRASHRGHSLSGDSIVCWPMVQLQNFAEGFRRYGLILLKKLHGKVGELKQSPEYYRAAYSHNREMDHVPAYFHSNRN